MRNLSKSLVDELDLERACSDEISTPQDQMPSRRSEEALAGHSDEFASLLRAKLTTGLGVELPEIIIARKATSGVRPLSVLPLEVRCVLRAIANYLRNLLVVSPLTFEQFKRGPLSDTKHKWVTLSDIASYYQYVGHEALIETVIAHTAEVEVGEALSDLLLELGGRRMGLPQHHESSDYLAEVFISVAERRLIRRGYQLWRYHDDFRFALESRRRADDAIEDLAVEAARLGLTLNDEKSSIKAMSNYKKWIDEPDEILQELAEVVEFDLTRWDSYGGGQVLPDDEDVASETAERGLLGWDAQRKKPRRYGLEKLAERQLVEACLDILTEVARPEGINFCRQLLLAEPSLTPRVVSYLDSVKSLFPEITASALDGILKSPRLSQWQHLWLLSLFGEKPLTSKQAEWATRLMGSSKSDDVRARAALALAKQNAVEPDDIIGLYDEVRPAVRGEVVAAVSIRTQSSKDPKLKSITNESRINAWIVDHFASAS
jgi:hypothetical protein